MKRFFAEGVATFTLVLVGTGAVVLHAVTSGLVTHGGVSFAFGAVVFVMILSYGRISGAHMNPAVSLGLYAARLFRGGDLVGYIVAQLLGAVAASALLKAAFPHLPAALGATLPAGSVTQSFVWEFLLSAILMGIILWSGVRFPGHRLLPAFWIGGTVGIEAFIGGPVSGASMNPARSLGPALLTGNFHAHWIYWVAPIGAMVGVATIGRLGSRPGKDPQPASLSQTR